LKKSFLNHEKPLLTAMLQYTTPDLAIGAIRNGVAVGVEAFGLQIESFETQFQNTDIIKNVFAEMKEKPIYITNYRGGSNVGKRNAILCRMRSYTL